MKNLTVVVQVEASNQNGLFDLLKFLDDVIKPRKKISSNIDDKIGTALDAITKSLTQDVSSPETNVNIKSVCTYMEQELLQMPPEVVEEFKDDVTTLLLQVRKKIRRSKNEYMQ
ncbi:hypothetical protein FQR65_LT19591 [Abscondita terminalis]|nr:hypothetical protein FQR65_LT19591 [Abscondita terminalis]